ncbi:ATP-binding protein [Candidatus Poribacteria bacterium]|nr:ATP-binding protein [Candidatus Poribacteria bacterium]
MPSNVCYIESVRVFIGKLSETLGFTKKRTADIQLALDEICSNAVNHGSKSTESVVIIIVTVDKQFLEVMVRDTGDRNTTNWFTPERLAEIQAQRTPEGEGGHGLYLIECLTDGHKIQANNSGGTDVTVHFNR